MGAYKYIAETFQKEYSERDETYKQRLMQWRRSSPIAKVETPTNISRARTLGYKAKKGYLVVRARVKRGSRKRPKPMGGRKPKNYYRYVSPGISYQRMAEQRVARLHKNMEVLNSYWVGDDGNYTYYEVILADPAIVNITAVRNRGRAFRGLTSAGTKGRPSKVKRPNKKIRRKMLRKKLAKEHGKAAAKARAEEPTLSK
jgi:large subunit ribosomal protein L15e